MYKLLTTTAVCLGLSLGAAQAQGYTTNPQGAQTPGPAATPPANNNPPAAATPMPNTLNPPSANPSSAVSGRVRDTTPNADNRQPQQAQAADPSRFLTQQSPQQMSAEDVIGATVYDANENNIGTVSDLVLDNSGMVQAAVIGVGGFLGIGEKDVAIRFSDLRHQVETDGDVRVILQVTREQLESAPGYVYSRDQRNTSGSATGSVGDGQQRPSANTGNNADTTTPPRR